MTRLALGGLAWPAECSVRPNMKTPHTLRIGSWIVSSVVGGALVGGCASSGTEPHAMSAGQHEAAAAREQTTAAEHESRYNPSATEPARGPGAGAYSACISYATSNCYVRWGSEQNPTDQHRKDADYHRKLADKHRAASQALRDAEQRFCSGLPESDRDSSPFYHREDIVLVEAIKKPVKNYGYLGGGNSVTQIQPISEPGNLLGARITFRAVPGMTGEWLQRLVDCHLARNVVVSAADQNMSFCPLAVPHATANVVSAHAGFAVDVTSEDEVSVREIVKRAAALAPGGPTALK